MAEEEKSAEKGSVSALARKLAVAREGTKGLKSSFILKALRRSLARAAADLCDLPLAVIAARQANRVADDLGSHLSDDKLLIVLDGPQGRIGAVAMDAATVTALIQYQTIGQVMGKAPTERHYTSTDAAMTAEFIDRSFSRVVAMLEGQSDQLIFTGFRFGARIDDVRSLLLAMEADEYRVIEITLDLACGKMQGGMTLVLPEPSAADLAGDEQAKGRTTRPTLGRNMGNMRAEMTAVLCKLRLPANELSELKLGDVLPLDQAFLYETELVSVTGTTVVGGRLGQINGSRAIRLNESAGDAGMEGTRGALPFAGGNHDIDDAVLLDDMGSGGPMGLSIAADGLQDPMDPMGGGLGMDLSDGDVLGGDLPMNDLGDFGGDADPMSMDLGNLGGDLAGGGLDGDFGRLGGDLALSEDEDDMGELLGGVGGFDPDEAMAEINELAGLGGGLGD